MSPSSKRIYLLVEVESVPRGQKSPLTCFHGIFDDLDAAKQGLRIVAEALMINPQIGDRAARGKLAEDPRGSDVTIYIQEFAQFNKVII